MNLWLYVLLTLSYKAFGGVGCEPGLAVRGLIRLLDKLKLTRDLPVIEEAQCLCLVLHVSHILKVELKEEGWIHEARWKNSSLYHVWNISSKYLHQPRSLKSIHSFISGGLLTEFIKGTQSEGHLLYNISQRGIIAPIILSYDWKWCLPLAWPRLQMEYIHFPFCLYCVQSLQRSSYRSRCLLSWSAGTDKRDDNAG